MQDLPSPDLYDDWKTYAKALLAYLSNAQVLTPDVVMYFAGQTPVTPDQLPTPPAGYSDFWLKEADATLFLANPEFDPPPGGDLFQLGEDAIADAAIKTAKIDDLAVNSAKIANLAVIAAKIANLAVGNAMIQNLAVGSGNIQDLAVGAAKIQDLAVTSAKIANLVASKISSGTLDAIINIGAGRFDFTVGAFTLYIGNGFGSNSQFLLWFGPTPILGVDGATETFAKLYLKTNGDAYFGGDLITGGIKKEAVTTGLGVPLVATVGDFNSNGGPISVILSYEYVHTYRCDAGTGGISGPSSGTIAVDKSINSGGAYTNLYNKVAAESTRKIVVDGDPAVKDLVKWSMTATETQPWTPGVLATLRARATLSARVLPTFSGTNKSSITTSQTIRITTVE